jgi:hypothetical protein
MRILQPLGGFAIFVQFVSELGMRDLDQIADFLAESISRMPAGSCDHDHQGLFATNRRQNASNLIFAIFAGHE